MELLTMLERQQFGLDVGSRVILPDQASGWPFQTYLELGALPIAASCARSHARLILWEWGLGELGETVQTVISELVANAIVASEGLTSSRYGDQWSAGMPPVRLWLSSDKRNVLAQVWDGDHRMPVPREVEDLEAESGRGLLIVSNLCESWGTYRLQGASGKVVWALICSAAAEP